MKSIQPEDAVPLREHVEMVLARVGATSATAWQMRPDDRDLLATLGDLLGISPPDGTHRYSVIRFLTKAAVALGADD